MQATRLNSDTPISFWIPKVPVAIQKCGFALTIILSLGAVIAGFLALYHISVFSLIGSTIYQALLYGGGALFLLTLSSLAIMRCLMWRAQVAQKKARDEARHPEPSKLQAPVLQPFVKNSVSEPSLTLPTGSIITPLKQEGPELPLTLSAHQSEDSGQNVQTLIEVFKKNCAVHPYTPQFTEHFRPDYPNNTVPENYLSTVLWEINFIKHLTYVYTQLLQHGTPITKARELIVQQVELCNRKNRLNINSKQIFQNNKALEAQALQKFISEHQDKWLLNLKKQVQLFMDEPVLEYADEILEAIQEQISRYNEAMRSFVKENTEYGDFSIRLTPLEFFNQLANSVLESYKVDLGDFEGYKSCQNCRKFIKSMVERLGGDLPSSVIKINQDINSCITQELYPLMKSLYASIVSNPIDSTIKNLRILAEKIPQGEECNAMEELKTGYNQITAESLYGDHFFDYSNPKNTERTRDIKLYMTKIANTLNQPQPVFIDDLDEAIKESDQVAKNLQSEFDHEEALRLNTEWN